MLCRTFVLHLALVYCLNVRSTAAALGAVTASWNGLAFRRLLMIMYIFISCAETANLTRMHAMPQV